MLSFQFINATDGGPNYTWSSIALEDNYASGSIPMPLVVADLRSPGEKIVGANSTVMALKRSSTSPSCPFDVVLHS